MTTLLSMLRIDNKFPIRINRTELNFGDNIVSLRFYGGNGGVTTATLLISRSRPFAIQCRAEQSDNLRFVIITCSTTNADSQTITGLQYSINDGGQRSGIP